MSAFDNYIKKYLSDHADSFTVKCPELLSIASNFCMVQVK